MLTGVEYRRSLADGRRVYHAGKLLAEIEEVPLFALAVSEVAAGYDRFHSDRPGAENQFLAPPRSVEEMRQKAPELVQVDALLSTTYQTLNALTIAGSRLDESTAARFGPRMAAYVRNSRRQDIRIAECITDAKGDRSKHPAEQPDPDAYVRVVERRSDGVVIRGAKLHVSGAAFAHDLVVLPTKTMRPGEEEYAIACAVPVSSPGVHLTTGGYVPAGRDRRDFPISGYRHAVVETTCIFDDVFVPEDRIFLDGQTSQAAVLAHSLGLWERLGGVSFMVNQADVLVGLAQLIAEANGTARIAHIREKIDEMIIHATSLRAAFEAAISNAKATRGGAYYPDDMYTNVAKYLGATGRPLMVQHLHDIAGGSVVTGPSMADFDNPDLAPLLEKYMTGSPIVSGAGRARLFHAIRDLTADSYGGWWAVGNLQGGGGLFAQRLVTRRLYDMDRAKAAARQLAGLDDDPQS